MYADLSRSSTRLHSFQGIFALSQKAQLCNPCPRNEVSPFSQEVHFGPPFRLLALKALPNCRRARPRHSLRRCNDCAYMERAEADVAQGRASIRTGAARE